MTREMLFALALGYLLGSIPFGLLLTRLAGKGDIRDIGSGNIGATNVLRTGSKPLAALTLDPRLPQGDRGDPARRSGCSATRPAPFAAAGALVGHLYPVWLRFRGGKGVATLLGILIALLPIAAVVYAAVWILLLLTIRISSVAGMTAAISAPITAARRFIRLSSQCCSVSRCWCCGSTARISLRLTDGNRATHWESKA